MKIDESNFLDFLSSKKYVTAQFSQSTYKDSQERKVIGEIKANRKGMFKLVYEEPLNEIISSKFVKEIANLGGNIDRFVTKSTVKVLKNNF